LVLVPSALAYFRFLTGVIGRIRSLPSRRTVMVRCCPADASMILTASFHVPICVLLIASILSPGCRPAA